MMNVLADMIVITCSQKTRFYGQSYVPIQRMSNTFIPSVGLKMGTIFPELVSPYMPCQSCAEHQYLVATNSIKEGCNKC
ncbi:MAG: spore coat associated protein CotJA [Clostridia bacterium]